MVIPFLLLYLTREKGFEPEIAGLVLTVYGLGSLSASLASGWLCDRIGTFPILLASLVGTGVLLPLFPLLSHPLAIGTVALALGLINESFRPAAFLQIGNEAPGEQRRLAFSVYRWALNLGSSIGPALGGLLVAYSFRALFIVDSITSLAAAAFLWAAYGRVRKPKSDLKPVTIFQMVTTLSRDTRYLIYLLAILLTMLLYSQHDSTLSLYVVKTLGLTPRDYGFLFVINGVLILIFEMPISAWTKHWSYRRSLTVGAILHALGFGTYGLASNFLGLAVASAIFTFGEIILFPAAGAYVSEVSSERLRASYMGAMNTFATLGSMLAPTVGVFVFENIGPRAVWALVASVGALSALLFWRFTKNPE